MDDNTTTRMEKWTTKQKIQIPKLELKNTTVKTLVDFFKKTYG